MAAGVKDVEAWGGDMVHCDVMDGVYVKNLTFGMPMIKALRRETKLPLDVHLMIIEPERYIEQFIDCGADIVTFHPEASKDAEHALKIIRGKGVKSGIVFNRRGHETNINIRSKYRDMILVMSVLLRTGRAKFILQSLDRIKKVKHS